MSVDRQVEHTNDNAYRDKYRRGYVGVDNRIQVMQKEAAVIGFNSDLEFEELLGKRKRARPRTYFNKNSPHDRSDMEAGEKWAPLGPDGTKDHPNDPGEMNGEDGNSSGL